MKDEKLLDSVIRIKPNEKMYLMIPMTATHFTHRLSSLIDMTSYISTLIL